MKQKPMTNSNTPWWVDERDELCIIVNVKLRGIPLSTINQLLTEKKPISRRVEKDSRWLCLVPKSPCLIATCHA